MQWKPQQEDITFHNYLRSRSDIPAPLRLWGYQRAWREIPRTSLVTLLHWNTSTRFLDRRLHGAQIAVQLARRMRHKSQQMVFNPIRRYPRPPRCRVGLRLLPHSLPTEWKTARTLLPEGIPLLHVLLWNHAAPAILDSQPHLLEDRESQVPLNSVWTKISK